MKTESATTTHDGASDAPWKSPTLPANAAWADFRPTPAPKTNALTLQLKATTAFRESLNSDDDSGDDSDEENVDYWPDPGAERFQLFRRIFVEDGELRSYFEENHKAGEFFCFVCGGIGKKSSGRSFKSCQGLLQHVAAMSKVERSQSHRAFGLVVCKVLGWDFDQIPSVVLKGEPLGRTLGANACAEKREEIASVKDNVEVPSDNRAGLLRNESSSGKGDSVGDVTLSIKVVCDDNTVVKKVFESNDKGRVESKGGLSRDNKKGLVVIGTSEVGGNENKSMIQPCSEGKAGSGNQAKEEKASEDSDNEEEDVSEDGNEEEEEEDPSEEEEDEDEDPSENGNGDEEEDPDIDEEEDPDEVEEEDPNENEEEDPSEEGSEEEEEEDPSEDGNDNINENKSGAKESKRSTMSKSCSLDQSMSQLGITQGFNQPLGSSSGWPCGEAVVKNPSANMGWPVLTPRSTILLSSEEKAMLASDKLQHKAVKLCKNFLRTRSSLENRDDINEEEKEQEEDPSEDSESENEDASGYSKEFNFFLKLFSEDVKLRDFYANNRGSRDFCCLVCGGVGKKDWKRFTSVALVQHSTAISKTRKKRAHRAYGEVVCGVLGWDKNRLPSIVMRSESHGQDQPWMKLNAVRSVEGTI